MLFGGDFTEKSDFGKQGKESVGLCLLVVI